VVGVTPIDRLDPGADLETPVLRVAVLRSESESLHNPAWDPVAAIEEDFSWRVELFTERDFQTLFDVQHEFDCVVFAHNVMARRPDIAQALRTTPFTAGILMLQQKTLHGPMRLSDDLEFDVADFSADVSEAAIASRREAAQEVLLNWPCPVPEASRAFSCDAVRGLVLAPHSPWRVVLEADHDGHRIPVLARSPASAASGIVVSTLLLSTHHEHHRRLLRNMVTLCADGRPETAVLGNDRVWRRALVRKLRLRGLSALSLSSDTAPLSFDRWPLLGVAEVFVRAVEVDRRRWLEQPDVTAWLEAGGRLVQVDDSGRTETIYDAPDIHWVARRFAGRLNASAEGWGESILSCRAVVMVLRALEMQLEEDTGRFGIPSAEGYRPAIRELVSKRLRRRDNIDNTVSTTVSVIDLDRMLPGLLTVAERDRIGRWLRAAHPGSMHDDQVEVARALEDASLLDHALVSVPAELTVGTATRLRRAGLAVGRTESLLHGRVLSPHAPAELASSLLVAADYLSAVGEAVAVGERFDEAEAPLVDVAIATLRKRGAIAGANVPSSVSVEVMALEARAVAAMINLDPTAVGIAERAGQLPPALVDDVLRETARLRNDNSANYAVTRAQQRSLTIAQHALTAVVVTISVAVAAELTSGIETTGDVLAAGSIFVGVDLALAYVLERAGLMPSWTKRMIGILSNTATRARTWIADLGGEHQTPEVKDGRR
jgi:hypothetical protein